MVLRRELAFGLFGALISVLILGGGLTISLAEKNMAVAGIIHLPSATLSPTVTLILPTELPGDPTYTPSPTPTNTPLLTNTILPFDNTSLPPICSTPSGWQQITVNSGDTLKQLAHTYQTTVDELIDGNCLLVNQLPPGSTLFVPNLTPTLTPIPPTSVPCGNPPAGWMLYTVKSGDTLFKLGQTHGGVTVAEIQVANCLNTTVIFPGQKIYLPYSATATSTAKPTTKPTTKPTKIPTKIPTKTQAPTPSKTPTHPVPSPTPPTPPPPPTVATDSATGIVIDGAILNGTVNANNDNTIISFNYGPDTNYGTTGNTVTASQSPVTGAVNTSVSITLSGLTPNTTYYYRVVGVNSAGTTVGADQTFTTDP